MPLVSGLLRDGQGALVVVSLAVATPPLEYSGLGLLVDGTGAVVISS